MRKYIAISVFGARTLRQNKPETIDYPQIIFLLYLFFYYGTWYEAVSYVLVCDHQSNNVMTIVHTGSLKFKQYIRRSTGTWTKPTVFDVHTYGLTLADR